MFFCGSIRYILCYSVILFAKYYVYLRFKPNYVIALQQKVIEYGFT